MFQRSRQRSAFVMIWFCDPCLALEFEFPVGTDLGCTDSGNVCNEPKVLFCNGLVEI